LKHAVNIRDLEQGPPLNPAIEEVAQQ
jgi:hypothetical protein